MKSCCISSHVLSAFIGMIVLLSSFNLSIKCDGSIAGKLQIHLFVLLPWKCSGSFPFFSCGSCYWSLPLEGARDSEKLEFCFLVLGCWHSWLPLDTRLLQRQPLHLTWLLQGPAGAGRCGQHHSIATASFRPPWGSNISECFWWDTSPCTTLPVTSGRFPATSRAQISRKFHWCGSTTTLLTFCEFLPGSSSQVKISTLGEGIIFLGWKSISCVG